MVFILIQFGITDLSVITFVVIFITTNIMPNLFLFKINKIKKQRDILFLKNEKLSQIYQLLVLIN